MTFQLNIPVVDLFTDMYQELDHVIEELEKIAVVHLLQHRLIILLVGNVQRSSLILEKVIAFCLTFIIVTTS